MENNKKTFFRPWIGEMYNDGVKQLGGARTMILAPHQWCAIKDVKWKNCVHKYRCCNPDLIREMDDKCDYPEYEGNRLSDGDNIEVERFVNPPNGARHEVFIQFTCGILNKVDDNLSEDDKKNLCDHIIFHNFLQHYVPDRNTPPYNEQQIKPPNPLCWAGTYKRMYDLAIPALNEVLNECKPNIIITWSNAVCEALKSAIDNGNIEDYKFGGKIINFKISGKSSYLFIHTEYTKTLPLQLEGKYYKEGKLGEILEVFYNKKGYHFDERIKRNLYDAIELLCRKGIFSLEEKLTVQEPKNTKNKGRTILKKAWREIQSLCNKKITDKDFKELFNTCISIRNIKSSIKNDVELSPDIEEFFRKLKS